MAKSEDWQCNKRLAECLGYMFDTATFYDVTFVVGRNREVIHAHKLILISRNPVFYVMFEGPMSEKGDITVPDIERDIFALFLRYLYTDDIKLTCENVAYLLYTAKKYCVDLLEQECREFLKTSLKPENACTLLEHAHRCREDQQATECRKVILANPNLCLKTPGFTDLCPDCILNITQSDDLMTSEDEVFKAVLRWAEAECKRQTLDVNDANKRQVLGDVINNIRFPCMNDEVFKQEVLYSTVLTDHEIVELERIRNRKDYESDVMFNSSQRKISKFERIIRFHCSNNGIWNQPTGSCNAISFSLSKHALFYGIGVYGAKHGFGIYNVTLMLYDQNDIKLAYLTQAISTDQTADIFEIKLNNPMYLKSSIVYTVAIDMTGPIAKKGIEGKTKVSVGDIDVTFKSSDKSRNGTNVFEGQIPCLLLSGV